MSVPMAHISMMSSLFEYLNSIVIIFFVLVVILSSCDFLGFGSEDDGLGDSCMAAQVDGENFDTKDCLVTEWYDGIDGDPVIAVGGGAPSKPYIDLEMAGLKQGETGTFEVTGKERFVGNTRALYTEDRGLGRDDIFRASEGQGTITVDKFTEEVITGSFQFEASTDDGASVDVTDGKFRIEP